jgi:hypothetical protein
MIWSGRSDLNRGKPAPKAGGLNRTTLRPDDLRAWDRPKFRDGRLASLSANRIQVEGIFIDHATSDRNVGTCSSDDEVGCGGGIGTHDLLVMSQTRLPCFSTPRQFVHGGSIS